MADPRCRFGLSAPDNRQMFLSARQLADLERAGLTDVTPAVYEGARHEVFDETDRAEVVADLLRWLDRVVPAR